MLITSSIDAVIGVENASKIRNISNDIINKYTLTQRKITILISKRIKRSAGNAEAFNHGQEYVIKLNYTYFEKFGIDRIIQTLKHEFAHVIQYDLNGSMSHDREFKQICHILGGSMSPNMAGETFSASASNEYLRVEWKYKYVCPCGEVFKRARRMSEKMRNSTSHSCPKCKTKVKFFKEVKI